MLSSLPNLGMRTCQVTEEFGAFRLGNTKKPTSFFFFFFSGALEMDVKVDQAEKIPVESSTEILRRSVESRQHGNAITKISKGQSRHSHIALKHPKAI